MFQSTSVGRTVQLMTAGEQREWSIRKGGGPRTSNLSLTRFHLPPLQNFPRHTSFEFINGARHSLHQSPLSHSEARITDLYLVYDHTSLITSDLVWSQKLKQGWAWLALRWETDLDLSNGKESGKDKHTSPLTYFLPSDPMSHILPHPSEGLMLSVHQWS